MATSLAQAVDHLPPVVPHRPLYEGLPYVLVVCQTAEGTEIAAVGFRMRDAHEIQASRVCLQEARFVSMTNRDWARDAIQRVRKAAAGRPIDTEHHNGYGSSDLYVDGNLFVLEPPIADVLTLYRPSYVVGIAPAVAERLRLPEQRRPVPPKAVETRSLDERFFDAPWKRHLKAIEEGRKEGVAWARDGIRQSRARGVTFAPEKNKIESGWDETAIGARGFQPFGQSIGLSFDEVEARGEEWKAACEAYNRGAYEAALETLAAEGGE